MPASATRRAVPDLLRAGLLATKIDPPHPRQRVVPRERLMSRLARASSGPLTVVSAPAGWGDHADDLARARSMRMRTHPFWPTVEGRVRGVTAYWSGDNVAARAELAAAAALAHSYGNAAGHTYALGYLALLAVEHGDLGPAERRLAELPERLDPGSDLAQHFVLALPCLAAGLLEDRYGSPARAVVQLRRAVEVARRGAGRLERIAALTAREAAVLRLLPTQLSLREIADELYVSRNTVKTHSRALYRKLAVRTRDDAVEAARGKGLLTP